MPFIVQVYEKGVARTISRTFELRSAAEVFVDLARKAGVGDPFVVEVPFPRRKGAVSRRSAGGLT